MKANIMDDAPEPAPEGFTSVPCGRLDVANNEKLALVSMMFLFPTRFEAACMRDAYYRLLRAWPILAGRLREGKANPELWRVHVPSASKLEELIRFDEQGVFTAKGTAPMFSYNDCSDKSLDSLLPLARFAKRNSTKLNQQAPVILNIDRNVLLGHLTSPFGLTSNAECFRRDAAIFSVHVVNFADGAGFSFTVPHVCFDGSGARTLLDTYISLLKGGTVEQPPPLGYDPFTIFRPSSDVADKKPSAPAPAPPGDWHVLSILSLLILSYYFALDLLWERPERNIRRIAVYIPPKSVSQIKAQARSDLEQEFGPGSVQATKLSTGAALHAWIIKNDLAVRMESWPDRLSTHATLANMRFRMPTGLSSVHPRYLSNCLVPIAVEPIKTRDLAARSHGRIALDVQETLRRKATPEELEKFVRWQVWRSTPPEQGGGHYRNSMAVFFPPAAQFTIVTDWSKFDLFDLDFSGGMESSGSPKSEGDDPEAKKVLSIVVDAHTPLHHRNAWTIAGGRNGECWLLGSISENERRHPGGWGKLADAEDF
ncbi:unnamed protein product [Tilletia laevis]|uniref:Uncharacterized protein n=2 Tax=Tilletia TaxID=13289 RepID=A0A177U4J7_9BASI|nr:hypothetical protein CF335_g7644 [Tilletia laevis]KAE8245857.1 hypothetical protein A4X03_0g7399 [Tilletia caries]CAD6892961.1 unnamed protein product [Tilletia caries]CAD6898184.1 unnamed protein product [Tilletia laevis]CAD6906457.1 unnamed protein product [Tilletia caries]